ncbi:sodium/proline symporter [Psychroflexus lacisalsi]|jgi:sodium/proline symporter|uniref:Sodium/proline symporter n=1 Tax=Psychroflexus lacisalsi TaxID=503928 RepID=A0ABP3VJV2_9FLAO|nr:sodium/proline symporter [Psychroflexus lacisalsi]MBZ9619574.1 sodium/proline symporter [Psychroflexus lacisalsi]
MLAKIIALCIYVLILFLIGYVASKRIKNISDFYVGGKKIGYWAVAFSARATGESGWILIGLTGMGALAGLSAFWVVVGEVLGVAISWLFMAKPFKRLTDKYDSVTVPDYLESHFKTKTHWLRGVSATVLSIFVVIYVSSQIDATGIAFESMLDMNYYYGAILGFLIVLVYIFVGGFVAVVWSDLFQGLLMFLGLVALPLVVWFSMDTEINIMEQLNDIDPALINIWGGETDPWLNLATILGFSAIGLGFLGSPQVYVRFMSIKNETEITKGSRVAILFTLLTDFAAVSIGILARVFFTESGQDPEAILGIGGADVLGMMTEYFLPLVLTAIYVAIILSAIMSTIDSLLVMASSAIVRDFYQKIFRPDISNSQLTKTSRWVTLIIALMALGLAMVIAVVAPERQVFWVIIFGWSGIAATFCPVIILSLFWKAYSEAGAIASMISGFLSVILVKFVLQESETLGIYFEKIDVLLPSFLIALGFGWLFTKLMPRPQ